MRKNAVKNKVKSTAASSAVVPEFNLKIRAVGGAYNNELVGRAYDSLTALRLLHLIRLTGGFACELSGSGLVITRKKEIGEVNLEAATKLIMSSRIHTKYDAKQLQYLQCDPDKDDKNRK